MGRHSGGSPLAIEPAEQRGLAFAKTNCDGCHAIGRSGVSALRIAPPFRDLHTRYSVDMLAEALAEGIVTGHPTMPTF
ncbi:c-type cytochrome [Methylopila sp. Yamaguchi]|uniref:c-type cytochrome n=1 Tax=Methylopila sp. Yamaguchi TaxID=1437817 RepID=UPI001FCE9F65|nr:cytochrome c [Methylopila sp. Yamaguchi]